MQYVCMYKCALCMFVTTFTERMCVVLAEQKLLKDMSQFTFILVRTSYLRSYKTGCWQVQVIFPYKDGFLVGLCDNGKVIS